MKYLRTVENILLSFSFFPFEVQYKGKEKLKERLNTLQSGGFKKDKENIKKDWQNVGKDIRKALVKCKDSEK